MTGYRFIGLNNELDSQLAQDLSVLSKFPTAQLQEFAALIVTWVVAPNASDVKSSVGTFAQTHSIDGSTIKASMRGLLLLVKGALKHNVTPQQLKGDLLALGMSSDRAETMEKVWRGNYMDLARSATVQTMTIKSLQDMSQEDKAKKIKSIMCGKKQSIEFWDFYKYMKNRTEDIPNIVW